MQTISKSSTPGPGDRLVHVIITPEPIAVMDPAVPLLEPVLSYCRRTFVSWGPLGYQELEEAVSLCDFDVKGRLCFAAGLLPRVCRTLREHGYNVSVEDQRSPGPRLRADESVLDDADAGVRSFLHAVVR